MHQTAAMKVPNAFNHIYYSQMSFSQEKFFQVYATKQYLWKCLI